MLSITNRIAAISRPPSLIDKLAPPGRICYVFSPVEDQAFEYLRHEATQLLQHKQPGIDYDIRSDAIGNLFVTWYGQNRDQVVMSGSHVDSVLHGGNYDGVAGVNSACNFLKELVSHEKKPKNSYTMAVFRGEESSPKTGVTCLGSRIATGTITEAELEKITYKMDDGSSVPLKIFFEKKYGVEEGRNMWSAILDEIKNPPITNKNVIVYEELHIEQSNVLDVNNVDVGIVIQGIGGASRYNASVMLKPGFVQTLENSPEHPYVGYQISFEGEEAHTGGTPPNPTAFRNDEQGVWYRKDALIGASHFLRNMFEHDAARHAKVTQLTVPCETGFTTVPTRQTLEVAVPQSQTATFEDFLNQMREQKQKKLAVNVDWKPAALEPGAMKYYDTQALMHITEVPLYVEQMARESVAQHKEAHGGGVGTVRGTVTDLRIDPSDAVKFNIDFRDVDTIEITNVKESVRAKIQAVGAELEGSPRSAPVLNVISEKKFVPLDAASVAAKEGIARDFGYTFVKMPSLPGHDGASLGQAGIPVTMTFVRHDGRSHIGTETMAEADYAKAQRLSHAFMAKRLGLTL